MKTTTSLYDVAEHLRTPEEHGSLFGKLHARRLMGDAVFHCKGAGRHCTCPGMTQGGQRFGAFQGEPLQGRCLESAAPKL